jgi:uncharacterized membrane protein
MSVTVARRLIFTATSFIVYSALGWLIESSWRTFGMHEPLIRGPLYPLPFKPVYGFGALIVILLAPRLARVPLIMQWLSLTLILAAYELLSGMLAFAVYRRHLWHYDDSFLNVLGYTDAFHAVAWGLLGLVVLRWFHPRLRMAILGRRP